MNRRNFLTSMLAACAAPAIVRADSLMRIVPRNELIFGFDLASEDSISVVFSPYDFTREVLDVLHKNIAFVSSINRDFSREYGQRRSIMFHDPNANRLTTEFEAPKFPSVGQFARPEET